MDISRIKEDTELTSANTSGFHVGDHIVIQVKFDGSNASFRYDEETKKLNAFSREYPLTFDNTLSGFWNFVESLDADKFKKYPNYVFFGEWAVRNKIVYKPEYRKIWLMYDVYDVENQCYLPQVEVKGLADELGFNYIHVLYDGPFISWDHCKSFMNQVIYSESIEEGCFDFHTKILMGDGTQKNINKIKVGDIVKSYNLKTNKIENKKVLKVFNNGRKPIDEWNSLAVFPKGTAGNKSITGRFCCTKNHKFYDGSDYSEIRNIDHVYHYGVVFDDIRKQMFLGLLASDICYEKKCKTFRLNQLESRSNDLIKIFEPFLSFSRRVQISGKGSRIINLHFLKQYTQIFLDDYIKDNKVNFLKIFKELNVIGWTYFFIGDGCGEKNGTIKLSFASNSDEEVDTAVKCFKNVFNINSDLVHIDSRVSNGSGKEYHIKCTEGREVMKKMSKYIPEDFRYKIIAIEDNADSFISLPKIEFGLTKRKIFSKKEINELKNYKNRKNIIAYDLEVEENHNYFANGCLVHNCVCKNMSNLNGKRSREPFVLKIVNEKFAEVMKHRKREVDPEKESAREKAQEIVNQIVTRRRVEKEIYKLRDEGVIPEKLNQEDLKIVARVLPKRIYEDCVKEENESVLACGEFFGKLCGGTTMAHARSIILGD